MARPTLLSDRPEPAPESVTPAAPQSDVVPRDPGRRDLADWLTRDLRVKGAPSERPPAERPPAERPSQPHTVVITDASEPPLAGWLLQDLKPRSSSLPPEALGTTLLGSRWESVGAPDSPAAAETAKPAESAALATPPAQPESPAQPVDSLVPHAVSEAPAPLALRDAALDDEDLAVLPSRRRKKRDWRKVVVLAALLSVAGAVLWVTSAPRVEEVAGTAAAAPAVLTAPLPPPPPSELPELEPEAPLEAQSPATPTGQGSGALAREPELEPASGPRGRRAGDAVARFADLPSPTLSRLAREEQQRLRKAARQAKRAAAPQAGAELPLTEPEAKPGP